MLIYRIGFAFFVFLLGFRHCLDDDQINLHLFAHETTQLTCNGRYPLLIDL
jgi:hypothetical protein